MFNLEQYPSILLHFKSISRIFKRHSSGWYEIFCPYCDDATRKANPNHGHFNLSPDAPFGHCFRCGAAYSLYKILIDTGFKNQQILDEVSKFGNITYNSSKKIKFSSSELEDELNFKLIQTLNEFKQKYFKDYLKFEEYIYNRCFEIDILKYLLVPSYIQNNLVVKILNKSGKTVTNRFINPTDPSKRYFIPNDKPFYYFQNIENIIDYENIIICEGAFDLINLHKYNNTFNAYNSFYISIGGSNYKTAIQSIVSNFLLIGNYNINIVLDNDRLEFIDYLTQSIMQATIVLNPQLEFNFYKPSLFKDVSDCCLIEPISESTTDTD